MKVHLTVIEGKPRGATVALSGSAFLIGRDPECQLRLKNESVGGRHCTLSVHKGRLAIRDLGSELGTLLNGSRIDPEVVAAAHHGDRLQVGKLVFEVSIKADADAHGQAIADDLEDDSASSIANRLIQRSISGGSDPAKGVGDRFSSEMIEGAPVVTIQMHRIVDEQEIIPFARGLRDLAERPALNKVILVFKHVKEISPAAAERLLAYTQRVKSHGTAVRLCEVDPRVMSILDDKGVGLQVSLHLDVHDALWGI